MRKYILVREDGETSVIEGSDLCNALARSHPEVMHGVLAVVATTWCVMHQVNGKVTPAFKTMSQSHVA